MVYNKDGRQFVDHSFDILLEREVKRNSKAVTINIWQFAICQPPYIIYSKER